jgi:hypothetical protein
VLALARTDGRDGARDGAGMIAQLANANMVGASLFQEGRL